jgi:predicted transcriptional regulator
LGAFFNEMSRKIYLHQIGQKNPHLETNNFRNNLNIPFQYSIENLKLMTKEKLAAMVSKQRTRYKWWAKAQNFTFNFNL